jgi:hypothetical protein
MKKMSSVTVSRGDTKESTPIVINGTPLPSKPVLEEWLDVESRLSTVIDEDNINLGPYASFSERPHWTTSAVTFIQKLPREEKEE